MTNKHTKGPWRWTKFNYAGTFREGMTEDKNGSFEGLIDGNGNVIGVAEDASSYAASFECGNKFDKNLIALAPELLEALEAAEVWLKETYHDDVCWEHSEARKIKEALEKSREEYIPEEEVIEDSNDNYADLSNVNIRVGGFLEGENKNDE